ncbi:hypothetical protein CEXT_800111 [Caerostris extrusa]|uniref:Uncharacterized protein n=1 Tax=Caerostris extrusa TaxID=172846 RepID=A0AAV4WRY1_CAEEX|nr:hypothetical protein CEXT_800111 [Caerostris extrusa]
MRLIWTSGSLLNESPLLPLGMALRGVKVLLNYIRFPRRRPTVASEANWCRTLLYGSWGETSDATLLPFMKTREGYVSVKTWWQGGYNVVNPNRAVLVTMVISAFLLVNPPDQLSDNSNMTFFQFL